MRNVRLSLLFVLALLATSCASRPRDMIVGKWESVDDKEKGTVELGKDGSAKINLGLLNAAGKYTFMDEKNLEIEIDNPFAAFVPKVEAGPVKVEAPPTIKFKRTIVFNNKNELVATDSDGKSVKFKRVE